MCAWACRGGLARKQAARNSRESGAREGHGGLARFLGLRSAGSQGRSRNSAPKRAPMPSLRKDAQMSRSGRRRLRRQVAPHATRRRTPLCQKNRCANEQIRRALHKPVHGRAAASTACGAGRDAPPHAAVPGAQHFASNMQQHSARAKHAFSSPISAPCTHHHTLALVVCRDLRRQLFHANPDLVCGEEHFADVLLPFFRGNHHGCQAGRRHLGVHPTYGSFPPRARPRAACASRRSAGGAGGPPI